MNQPEFEYLGPYHVERILGRGGMGTVYKGVHNRSGKVMAIKVIAAAVANSARFRRRFHAEITTLHSLSHPNIVRFAGAGEERGMLFYTMEYVDGVSLHDHLRQSGQLPWEQVLQIGIETSAALKHAHDWGIIHRDLKPANLLLTKSGHVKLADFGISKLFGLSEMTAVGSVIGTADYMPPEQAEGKIVTVRSDLYSLGGVLYALLCGRAPFGGKSVPEVLYAVRYNPPPNLAERVAGVPPELVELIHELLEKSPSKRPPNALVLGNRLKALQQGLKKMRSSGGLKESNPASPASPTEPDLAGGKTAVGTHLTSLDLSDMDDRDLRVTAVGGEDAASGAEVLSPSSEIPLETHEQQTMLAPADFSVPSIAKSPPTSLGDAKNSVQESEFTGEFESQELLEEPPTSGGPTHYTPVEEAQPRDFKFGIEEEVEDSRTDWLQWGSIGGMIVLLLGSLGFLVWMLQPRSADELYGQILVAAESGDDAQLIEMRTEMEEFVSRFAGDERSSEVQALIDESELVRLTRVLRRRASRNGGAEELSAAEQGFLECMTARMESFEVGQEKLAAFLSIFGQVANLPAHEARLVELAEYAARVQLPVGGAELPQAATQLANLIQSAEKSLSPERLQTYFQDLELLYGDKPWAGQQLKRLRAKLESE